MNLLSPKTVAKKLDCSIRQANRLMHNGTLPSFPIGGLRRCSEEALEKYLRRLERTAEVTAEKTLANSQKIGSEGANPQRRKRRSLASDADNLARIVEQI
jgi:excisionase family DNA binding protein